MICYFKMIKKLNKLKFKISQNKSTVNPVEEDNWFNKIWSFPCWAIEKANKKTNKNKNWIISDVCEQILFFLIQQDCCNNRQKQWKNHWIRNSIRFKCLRCCIGSVGWWCRAGSQAWTDFRFNNNRSYSSSKKII